MTKTIITSQRKIRKWGNSLVLKLTPEEIEIHNLRPEDVVDTTLEFERDTERATEIDRSAQMGERETHEPDDDPDLVEDYPLEEEEQYDSSKI